MNKQSGTLIRWDAEKRFGFIRPDSGGKDVWVHRRDFGSIGRTPREGDRIRYQPMEDDNGRYRAADVEIEGVPRPGRLPPEVLIVYFIMSIVTFMAYAYDKSSARNGCWSTQESTLHLFGLCGGWPGGWAAQQILRHKSVKQEFRAVFWCSVALNLTLLWLLTVRREVLMALVA